jgi:hypothetical protein
MVTLTAILVVALISTAVMLVNQRTDSAQLTEQRAVLRRVGIQIICGDCCGEGERPFRTYLDELGNCTQCGGHSYVLAGNVYAHALKTPRIAECDRVTSPGRLLAFNPSRQEKIAV